MRKYKKVKTNVKVTDQNVGEGRGSEGNTTVNSSPATNIVNVNSVSNFTPNAGSCETGPPVAASDVAQESVPYQAGQDDLDMVCRRKQALSDTRWS
jgi:hypothetical protein